SGHRPLLHAFPTRRSSDLTIESIAFNLRELMRNPQANDILLKKDDVVNISSIFDMRENYTVDIKGPVQKPNEYEFAYGMTLEDRSEEHTSELQSRFDLVCR